MDKRSEQRNYFKNEANQAKSIEMHSERSTQLLSIEETIANAFKSLLDLIDGKITKTEIINHLDSIKTPDVENVVKALNLLDKDVLSTKIDTKPLLDALNGLKREITLIPAKMPTQKELKDIKVSNLSEIKLDTSAVEKAIKALDLKVDVKAPIVNVDKTDIEPLRQVMLDLLKAINKQEPIEEVRVSNLKDIVATDLTKVEKKLDESNKHLKTISEKRFGGGGGGGNGSPYTDSSGTTKNVILTPSGKIPVDATLDTTGLATEAKQDTQITLATTLNTLNTTLQKTVLSWDKVHKLLQETRDAVAMPLDYDDPTNARRITGSVSATIASGTVTTVGTVTNQTNIGGFSADMMAEGSSFQDWGISIRSNLI